MKIKSILFNLFTISSIFSTVNVFSQTNNGDCRLLLNFKSIGSGIDSKTQGELVKLSESNGLKYETKNWGREGEIKYCFTLSELSKRKQKKFIKKVKKLLVTSQYVDLQENTPLNK
jgi:hypothetical protein